MREAVIRGAEDLLQVKTEMMAAAEKQPGVPGHCCCWMPLWSPKPFIFTQSDVSCMLSPAMFEQFVLPELEITGRNFPLWYHLDGGNAKQHLPILLSLPYLKFIQYTPTPSEPPNGLEHLAFYRQIQNSGKVVHVAVSPERITEALVKGLDPSRILISTWMESQAQAEELLARIAAWCE